MLEVSLALLVVAGYAAFKLSEDYDDAVNLHLRARVKALDTVKSASEQYAARYYTELVTAGNPGSILTPGTPITVQVASPGGDSSYTIEDANHPSIKDLVALHLLTQSFSSSAIGGGAYGIALETSPAGCAGVGCNIEGIAFIDKPYQANGKINFALAGRSVQFLGADGMTSLPRSPQVMSGYGGKFALPNPVVPALAGIIGSRFEYRGPVKTPAMPGQFAQAATSGDAMSAAQFVPPRRDPDEECSQDGEIASGSSGILFCSQGRFQEVAPMGSQGDVCRAAGSIAKDKATLEALVCKNDVLVRLSNLLARTVTHSTVRVTDGMRLAKPVCEAGGVASFQASPSSEGVAPSKAVRSTAVTSGKAWMIRLEGGTDSAAGDQGGAVEPGEILDLVCVY